MYLVRGVMEPANTNCKHFCCFTHLHLGTCRPTASPTFGNYRAMFTMFTSHVIPLGGWLVYGEPICACKELSMAISSGCVLYSLIENWLSIQIKYGAEHEFNGHNQFVIQTAQNGRAGGWEQGGCLVWEAGTFLSQKHHIHAYMSVYFGDRTACGKQDPKMGYFPFRGI